MVPFLFRTLLLYKLTGFYFGFPALFFFVFNVINNFERADQCQTYLKNKKLKKGSLNSMCIQKMLSFNILSSKKKEMFE